MKKPTLHVLGLPHIQITKAYCMDAYGQKTLKFCQMMSKQGYKIYLYASEENETPAELVTCITKREQTKLGFAGPGDYLKNNFDNTQPLYKVFHQRVIHHMQKLAKPGDFILTLSGHCDLPVIEAYPKCFYIEYGIGYTGITAPYRVYESWAWLHAINGANNDGNNYHTVIPNYFDPADFPFVAKKKDYLLFVGRMIRRKGLQIVAEMAKRMPDTHFILAGHGAIQKGNSITGLDVTISGDNLEYIGPVDIKRRGVLMSEAKALIVPTLYIGPFEGVQVEANFCGTPTITTNYGAFTENNIEGLTGYRCATMKQFVEATKKVEHLDPAKIRKYAISHFSMDVVAPMYTKYFEQVQGIANGGFYEQ